jgi:hypothetical protein
MLKFDLKERIKPYLTIRNVGFVFSGFSIIGSIVTIAYFSVALYRLNSYSYIYDYKEENCVPVFGYTYNFSCGDNVKWISAFNSPNNTAIRIIVENPFSVRNNEQQALNDIGRIDLNFNYVCYCRQKSKIRGIQILGCSVWADCIIDSDFIDYIQRDNSIYYFTFISFMVSSLATMIFSIISILIAIHEIKAINTSSYTELK